MIELLSRREILGLNKTFASFIVNWQHQEYNPSLEHNKYKPGMMYDIHVNKLRRYSRKEVDGMNRERLEVYNRVRDYVEVISIEDSYTGTLIYNFPYGEIENYVQTLSEGMATHAEESDWGSVIFLLVYPVPWLDQENDYGPVKNALDYLRSIGVTDDFTGGIKANGEDLEELMKHLFWIVRCNASLPYCFFSGIDRDVVGNICQYGNVHFYFYSEKEMIETKNQAFILGMTAIEKCFENFSESGVIKGRKRNFEKQIKRPATKPWWKFW